MRGAEERGKMIATIWGSRGSLATPGAATLAYGGNTSCVELRLDDGSTIVLDAGTGIRELGLRLANRPRAPINLLLTHLHLDHVAGLPFFAPLWDNRAELDIWAPFARAHLAEAIARYMSPPLFPVSISEVPASVTFHDLPERTWRIGSASVSAQPVRHSGPTVGYRIEHVGRSLAYLPDHEPYSLDEPLEVEAERLSGYGLARDASILIHDAQYFEREYPARSGWGHSSVAHAVAFASAARIQRLVLFHHDPLHSDDDLTALEARAAELWQGIRRPELAREGMRLRFGGEVAELAASG
jgi:phosphoribosyl 1,2-cyclic phosphodiesterase